MMSDSLPPSKTADQGRPSGSYVLILAHTFPPHNYVGALRPYRFFKYLRELGYSTHAITATKQNSDGPADVYYVPDLIQDRSRWWQRILFRVEYLVTRFVDLGGGFDSLTWPRSVEKVAEKLIAAASGQCYVISTFPPLCTHLAALRLKKRYGDRVKWIADFRDPLAHNPGVGAQLSFISKIETVIFREADHLIANTDTAAAMWRVRYPRWANKISHLFNGFDPEQDVKPLPIARRECKVIAHVGEIYGGRQPAPLVASLARLAAAGDERAKGTRLELTGYLDWRSMRDPELLRSLIQQGAVVLHPPERSADDAVRTMAEADALLLLDLAAGLQVPSKLFVYLRIGRPILAITSKGSPVDKILSCGGVPYTCLYPEDTAEQSDAKVAAFLGMSSDPVRASDWFFREFDGRKQVGALAAILQNGSSQQPERRFHVPY